MPCLCLAPCGSVLCVCLPSPLPSSLSQSWTWAPVLPGAIFLHIARSDMPVFPHISAFVCPASTHPLHIPSQPAHPAPGSSSTSLEPNCSPSRFCRYLRVTQDSFLCPIPDPWLFCFSIQGSPSVSSPVPSQHTPSVACLLRGCWLFSLPLFSALEAWIL